MSTKLDQLVKDIHPSQTIEPVEALVEQALNTFPVDSGAIRQWGEFQNMLSRLYRHVENNVLRTNPPLPPNYEFDWGRCNPLLDELYGRGGIKVAMAIAQSGAEGGLFRVLRDLAKKLAEKYAKNEISAKVNLYWRELSTEERLAAPGEYLEKFGHLLPSEFADDSAVQVRANFRKVLEEHAFFVSRLRNIGR